MAAVTAAGVVAGVLTGTMSASASAATATVTSVPCSTPALDRAVSGAVSGATLSLAKGCRYVLTAALPTVERDLTINGNGDTLLRSTATGTAAFTILTVNAGTVTLNRLSFTNGDGAVTANDLAQLNVTGGVFRGNTAMNGGAISDVTGATDMQVTGATFIDDTAMGAGGAIYIYTAGGSRITDCSFRRNAAGDGGAIYDWGTAGTLIAGSTFRGNMAQTGGALLTDDEAVDLTGDAIEDNSATGDGGGIYDSSGGNPVGITGSRISGNRAGGAGGGLDEEAAWEPTSMNSTIVENNSAADGGGINDVAGTMVNYAGDTISGNRARGDGGGINATDSSVAFSGTTISGNHARGDGGGVNAVGGGRYGVLFANASFTDSTISGNSVGKRGGGLYNQGPVEAADTQIAGNRAGDLPSGGGGGIYDDGSQATAALTNSSPFCNKPNNCEPIGSIAGCTDLTPQACRPCLSQGGSGAAPSSLTGRPHPALRGSARRPPARRSVRRATPDSPGRLAVPADGPVGPSAEVRISTRPGPGDYPITTPGNNIHLPPPQKSRIVVIMLLIVISGEVMTTKVGPSVTGTRCHPHRFRPRRDLGAAAERAVITFLRDASMTTAEREATGPLFGAGGRGWRGVYRIEG